MASRNDQRFQEYYQKLADVIGIFWVFHRERIARRNLPFSGTYEFEGTNTIVKPLNLNRCPREGRILNFWAEGVRDVFIGSWNQFLQRLDRYQFSVCIPIANEVPDSVNVFFSEGNQRYIGPLIQSAERLGGEISQVALHDGYTVEAVVSAGINTGSEVTTQLKALFGPSSQESLPLMISKIHLDSVNQARRGIGITKTRVGSHEGNPLYYLVDDSPLGIDREVLKSFGLGEAIGCPAGLPITQETRDFLTRLGFDPPRTMLGDFAIVLSSEFDRTVLAWYERLPEDERRRRIHPDELRLLSGEARKAAIEEAKTRREGGCPFGHGKEREM